MKVILSYGLGVDSTAILLRWLTDPTSRDFDLADLTVVTAMTGDEWAQTADLVEAFMLPMLAANNIRYVQLARTTRSTTDGIAILDDSRKPTRLHAEGMFKLSDEMRLAATVPQVGGTRLCSIHAKGEPLDTFISELVNGQPFRHVVGFEANETGRAERDQKEQRAREAKGSSVFPPGHRHAEFPLIDWGWDRQAAKDFIASHWNVEWPKSACSFCPFALSNKASRVETLARFDAHPHEGVRALMMEHLAVALNPTQTLVPGGLSSMVSEEVWNEFRMELSITPHGLYEVRRVFRPRADGKFNVARSVSMTSTGTRRKVLADMADVGKGHRRRVQRSGRDLIHARLWLKERAKVPTHEHIFALAPVGAMSKQLTNFETWWDDATNTMRRPA